MDNYLLNVAIFGAGGSGPSAQRSLITNPQVHLDIVLGVDDSGGSTGVVNEVMLKIDLNKFKAHSRFVDRRKILPIGDTRNNILRILNYTRENGRAIADLLDKRLPDSADLSRNVKDIISEVSSLLNLQEPDIDFEDLNNFINEYINAFSENKEEILRSIQSKSNFPVNQLKDLSVGNLFLVYFFLTSDSNEQFFERLKNIGLIPTNIDFHYLSEYRHVLIGTNNEGETVEHEHNIDVSTRPMMPGEYYLSPVDQNGNPTTFRGKSNVEEFAVLHPDQIDEKIKQTLLSADVIFPSTGSLSNLFAQARVLAETLSQFKGLMIHVPNFARSENEVHSQFALDRLYKILQKPFITLLVNDKLSSKIFSEERFRRSYQRQDKYFNEAAEVYKYLLKNFRDSIFAGRILPILNLIHGNETELDLAAEDFIDKGIKHEPAIIADITIFFGLIYKNIDFLDIQQEQKELFFNQIINSLALTNYENGELHELISFLKVLAMDPLIFPEQKFRLLSDLCEALESAADLHEVLLEFGLNKIVELKLK